MNSEKQITLLPSHKSIFRWYLLGVLLIPFFGLGIYLIYRFYSAHSSIEYVITDHSIRANDSKVSENVDLANILQAEVHQRWIDKKFGLGDIKIKTKNRSLQLTGLENPVRFAELILRAAEAERKRRASPGKKPKPQFDTNPGTLDKLDYLTGLWHQGLLSDDDYKKEKKHFE